MDLLQSVGSHRDRRASTKTSANRPTILRSVGTASFGFDLFNLADEHSQQTAKGSLRRHCRTRAKKSFNFSAKSTGGCLCPTWRVGIVETLFAGAYLLSS